MACVFAYLEDACGCLTGYQLPLKEADNSDITAYPVHVLNVNSVDLGEAATPSAYISLWNGDAANQAVGILSLGGSNFCFHLSRIAGVTPPSKVLGASSVVPPANFNFEYGETALDTTGGTPTEAQYKSSVDDVYTAGTEVAGTSLAPGSNINVDFTNVTDKVLFIEVDASEAAFTKWSEVGNPLQQDQPIDAAFAGTAVWFKTTRAGETLYITRAQTTFTGNIVLSR